MKYTYPEYKVNLPDGEIGTARIEHKTITEEDSKFLQLRAMINRSYRWEPPGTYTGLFINGGLVMSDTPDEISDHLPFTHKSSGDILIAGLGLGMVASACIKRNQVNSVTVVEINPDVIALVKPHLDKRIRIVQADANTYKPDQIFDMVWLDIWDTLCSDNFKQMHDLKMHYRKYTKTKRVRAIECWSEAWLRANER